MHFKGWQQEELKKMNATKSTAAKTTAGSGDQQQNRAGSIVTRSTKVRSKWQEELHQYSAKASDA